nr:MAG TPA: hypothetical protein [Herelleviridae sp.]
MCHHQSTSCLVNGINKNRYKTKNPERITTTRIHRKSIKSNVSMLERKRLTTSKRD